MRITLTVWEEQLGILPIKPRLPKFLLNCSGCGSEIERSVRVPKATCMDCKAKRRLEYDNSEVRKQARHERWEKKKLAP